MGLELEYINGQTPLEEEEKDDLTVLPDNPDLIAEVQCDQAGDHISDQVKQILRLHT